MSDMTFGIFFEVYLVAGTAFLFFALLNRRFNQWLLPLNRAFRPNWSEKHFQILKIFLLVIFVPLTIFNSLSLLGISLWNSR